MTPTSTSFSSGSCSKPEHGAAVRSARPSVILLFTSGSIRLSAKNGKVDEQPVTTELLQVLLTHALQRGDVLISKPDDLEIHEITIDHVTSRVVRLRTGAPILYYSRWMPLKEEVTLPDGTRTTTRMHDENGQLVLVPHPVGRKRYETLWNRLKRDLPWLDEFHGRPHDLRKSMGTFVERAFGHAVAQAWLRHKIVGTTEGYTAAIRSEVKGAHTWLVGGDPSDV